MTSQGDYRRLLLKPINFDWEIRPSSDSLQVGLNRAEEAATPMAHTANVSVQGHTSVDADLSGTSLDVAVRFDLPPGAYATMALREVMKERPAPSRLGHIRFDE